MSRMITIEDTAYLLSAMFPTLNKYRDGTPLDSTVAEEISPLPANTDIIILTHRYPDGDTLGSAFGLCGILTAAGLNARVAVNGTLSKKFAFLVKSEDWVYTAGQDLLNPRLSHDVTDETASGFSADVTRHKKTLVIAVDIASPEQLGDLREEFEHSVCLSIDHHAMNTPFARYTCERKAAANAENIYELACLLNIPIDKHIADCLYTGICTDTGCFRFSNVTPRTMRIAAELMDIGCDSANINRAMYETNTIAHLKMQEYALSTLKFYNGGKIAVIYTTLDMERRAGASESDMDGISSIPRTIEGVRVGITLKEKAENLYRVSVRTVAGYSAADICARFGGGGHHAAAGCTLRCTLDEAVERMVAAALL